MAFTFICFFALLASTQAGILSSHQAYSDAPSVSYSSISTPTASYGAPAYAKVGAPITYSAPAYKLAAPVSYAAPAYKVAAPVSYAAPSYKIAKAVVAEDYSAPAHYDFGYAVEDPHTGDSKSQHETREGDVVKGSYSLIEADGSKRIVEYTVDPHSGFNAVVHREPASHPIKAAPVGYAQPVFKAASPLAYSAPLVAKVPAFSQVAYSSAPQVSYSSISAPVAHGGPSYYH